MGVVRDAGEMPSSSSSFFSESSYESGGEGDDKNSDVLLSRDKDAGTAMKFARNTESMHTHEADGGRYPVYRSVPVHRLRLVCPPRYPPAFVCPWCNMYAVASYAPSVHRSDEIRSNQIAWIARQMRSVTWQVLERTSMGVTEKVRRRALRLALDAALEIENEHLLKLCACASCKFSRGLDVGDFSPRRRDRGR